MTKLSVNIKTPDALSEGERAAWEGFRAGNSALYSPYFHLAYTEALGKIRSDVHVLVISDGEAPIAFLPFQAKIKSGKVGFARPIGAPMTDYHGFICAAGTAFDVQGVLKQAGFGAFHFSALVDDKVLLSPYGRSHTACTVIDLAQGAQVWREQREASYRRHLKSHRRRVRKAEALGARRFEWNTGDECVFEQLLVWKREQFSDTGKYDVLSADWTRGLLENLWKMDPSTGLRVDMHALYFGEDLAAVDLGITDGTTYHSWMVAYNDDFHTLSPGIQLLEELIDASAQLGYTRVDLGEGTEGYKRNYASEDVTISAGFIAASGPAAALSRIYGAAEQFGENKLGKFGRLPGMARRRYAQIRACEPSFSGRAKAFLSAVARAGK